ncbi:MAG TPA: PAS domain S-box protein, partial [Xanthobacteraceae bacterium]|nr:PAS domain S-box protein [Xanthobacteraceae bacterium]
MRQLLGLSNCTITETYDHYLASARKIFGMDVAIIASVKDGTFTPLRMLSSRPLPIQAGRALALETTFSVEAIRTGHAISCPHVAHDPVLRLHPIYTDTKLESYMGAPIRIGEEIIGTFSLLDPAPRDYPFAPESMALLELLAETLGRAIERDRLEAERREADKERTAAIAFFQTAFANAPIGITLVDLDGKFLRANPAACRLFGYSEEELQARDFQSLTYPDDLSLDLEHLAKMKAGLISEYEMDKRYVRPDGTIVWAQLNVALVRNEDGSPRCFISQIHDITAE